MTPDQSEFFADLFGWVKGEDPQGAVCWFDRQGRVMIYWSCTNSTDWLDCERFTPEGMAVALQIARLTFPSCETVERDRFEAHMEAAMLAAFDWRGYRSKTIERGSSPISKESPKN